MRTSDTHDTFETLYTVEQIAERLNVKPSWVYTAVAARRIPYVKAGKHLRFNPAAVLKQFSKPAKP